MNKWHGSIAASILTLFVACQKEHSCAIPPNSTALGDTLRVKIGETVSTSDFSITLDSANDSRCEPPKECIWAGVATAQLTVKKGNSAETARFLLDPTRKNTVDVNTIFNRNLRLLNVFLTPNSTAPNGYFVELVVE